MRIWQLKTNSATSAIQKVGDQSKVIDPSASIENQINILDKEIARITHELIQAQAVGLKSALSPRKGWIMSFQKKWYQSAAQESANWHSQKLMSLHKERRKLQSKLDRLNGKYWLSKIKRLISYLILIATCLIVFWILIMGFLTTIYLIPLWSSILLAYFLLKKYTKQNLRS